MSESSFDELLDGVRAALHAQRAALVARSERIAAALTAYAAAVEGEIARRYAAEHGLKQPRRSVSTPEQAARALLDLVQALPELAAPAAPAPPPGPAPVPARAPEPEPAPEPSSWPKLLEAVRRGPLVVVGGVSKRERLHEWPERLRSALEWIDTTRQGTHAIGNLEKRIRERRLAALIVLEGVIAHRHSDPLIAAARQVALPHAYAGKGGRASLARALAELETALGR